MVIKMGLAFITALFTGVTLRTPTSAWLAVGFTGMMGWTVSTIVLTHKTPELVAATIGAMVVGAMAEILARLQKQPVTVYIVSGIIPLVPGTIAYNSMMEFLKKDSNQGLVLAFKAFLIAAYIAAGLAIIPLVVRNLKAVCRHCRKGNKRNLL